MKTKPDQTMLGAAFTHEVTQVSKIFGRDHDINVVIQGDQAGVDEQGNIVYPSIDQNAQLTEEQIKVSRGYVDHECGHKRHTDLKAFFRFGKKCRAEGKALLMGIANAMEDPRMEACVIKDYEGAYNNLEATANEVSRSWSHAHMDEVMECQSTGQRSENWHHFVAGALSIMGRNECWGFEGADYDEAIDTFQALLGDEAYSKCQSFTKQLGKCKSTKQVLKLAEKVGEWIVDSHQQDSQPDDQANSDQSGQDQGQDQNPDSQNSQQSSGQGANSDTLDQDSDTLDQDSDGLDDNSDGLDDNSDGLDDNSNGLDDNSNGSDGQDSDGNQSSASDNTSEGMDSESQSTGQGSGQGNGSNDDSNSQTQTNQVGDNGDLLKDKGHTVDVQDALNNTLGSQMAKSSRTSYKPFTTRFDQWHTRKGSNLLANQMRYGDGLNQFRQMLSDSAGKLNVIRRKLERALQSDKNVNWDGGQQFGRLDSRRLVAAFNRQEKVYKRKQDAPALDTAVTILLDMSHSMTGERIWTATQTLICLAEALEKTSISYNIIGHSINMDSKTVSQMDDVIGKHMRAHGKSEQKMINAFTRFSPMDMFEFKSFNERLGTAKTAIGNIPRIVANGNSHNGNADSEAIMEAYRKLAQRPEKKKVLIVLSDGMPNTCVLEARKMAMKTLKTTIHELERQGVDVMGIGIQSDAGAAYYSNWFEVMSLNDLAETVIDQLGAALLGKKNCSRRAVA